MIETKFYLCRNNSFFKLKNALNFISFLGKNWIRSIVYKTNVNF